MDPTRLLPVGLEPGVSGVGDGCTNKEAKDCSH